MTLLRSFYEIARTADGGLARRRAPNAGPWWCDLSAAISCCSRLFCAVLRCYCVAWVAKTGLLRLERFSITLHRGSVPS